jgi:hypothetical protein
LYFNVYLKWLKMYATDLIFSALLVADLWWPMDMCTDRKSTARCRCTPHICPTVPARSLSSVTSVTYLPGHRVFSLSLVLISPSPFWTRIAVAQGSVPAGGGASCVSVISSTR